MEKSLYIDWIAENFSKLVLFSSDKINDSEALPTYLSKKYLGSKFSIDGKWTSLSSNGKLVSADVIALDSSIPLKSRGSLGKATGSIPKMGMQKQLREQELTDLNTLVATGQMNQAIQRFFEDVPYCIAGVSEEIERIFLELLSTGVCELTNLETVGTGIRVDAGYLDKNKFDSDLPWSNVAATPITDLKQLIDEATSDSKKIIKFFMDRATFNKMKSSEEGKQMYAISIGNYGTIQPIANDTAFKTAFFTELGAEIEIVDRSVSVERDGDVTSIIPWEAGRVIGVTTNDLGDRVWAQLAEKLQPVPGVSYQTADEFILVSKYRSNTPSLMEVTNSQARVVPVLYNVQYIYSLDSTITTV